MKSGTDIHGAQTMYPTDFGDPLTSLLEDDICGFAWNYFVNYWMDCHKIEVMSPSGKIVMTLVTRQLFI